ncbi:MAG TPA: hypothetical protein VFJ82_14580, partial [Longimicrobium sp.]|nr:hypothetical protein [Longimicrobium sp.]
VLAADGTTLRTVTLGYGDGQGGTAFVGATDALKKRLLTSVHSSSAGGEALPGVRFSYYGQPGVTPAGPAGSLAAVMVPEGGITAFTYAEQTPALSSRDVALARPSAQGTAGAPRFAFADAYAVAAWPMTGPDSLQVAAYTWQGRWIERWLDAVPGGGSGYDASPVVTSGDFFALRSGAKLYLPHLDPWQVGEWARPSADGNPYFTLPLAAGEAAQVGVGDAFAAVLGQTGGTLSTFRWTGQAWAADAALTLAAGSTPAAFALAARGDWLLAAATASSAGDDPVHLRLAWLDGTGRWQGSTFQAARPTSIVSSLSLFAGDTFAVEKTVWSGATGTTAVYRAHRWSADRARLYTDPLLCVNLAVGADAPDPVVAGSTVAVGMQLFRWDGGAWVTADLGSPGVPTGATVQGAAYGPDLVLRTVRASGNGDYTADLLAYDPNTSAWSVKSSSTGAAAGATLAARTGGARSRYALLRGALLFQDPDGSWAGTFSLPSTADAASAQLLGERYLVAQDGADAAVWPLANGGVASATALKVLNARVSIPSSSPAALVGGEAFVTFTGTFGDADSALRLHRVVNGGVEGEQAVQAVTLLEESDGYQTVSTAYGYAAASATVGGGEGDGGRYGTVSTVPGSADATQQPNGRTDQRFFNGLTAHEATAAGVTYPTDSASTNATRYTARVAGLPYGTAVYPAGSNPGAVAGTLAYWYVTPVALGGLGAGAYARPLRGDRAQDGVTSRVELAFSATTGMLNRVATHSWDIDGNPRTEVEERSYACELYPAMAAANLLTSIAKLTTRAIGPSGGAGTVTGSAVTTWREDWGHGAGQWAPYRGYAA